MPRQARLDAPGTLHHVIVRGLERGLIVRDDIDRAAFAARLGDVAQAPRTAISAWALLPNHAHLLLRSGPGGLPRFMRRLLTGCAITFNRRHQRVGYLFQNRYKSIVCEEEAYFRELVRYLHLNPIRAKLVESLRVLACYQWCGHATVLGRNPRPSPRRRCPSFSERRSGKFTKATPSPNARPFLRCQDKILPTMPRADRIANVVCAVVPRDRSR